MLIIENQPTTFEVERAWGSESEEARERFDRNQQRADRLSLDSCLICGRGVKPGNGSQVHLIGGGSTALRRDLEPADVGEDEAGDMGFWTLGPECQRLVPAAYRQPIK